MPAARSAAQHRALDSSSKPHADCNSIGLAIRASRHGHRIRFGSPQSRHVRWHERHGWGCCRHLGMGWRRWDMDGPDTRSITAIAIGHRTIDGLRCGFASDHPDRRYVR